MKKKMTAFSLMEMMIVLLIIAIVIAASAPMVNKKMLTSMAEKSPWVWTNTNGAIAYNINGNNGQTAVIGATNRPNGIPTRLYIEKIKPEPLELSGPQILLGYKDTGSFSPIMSYAGIDFGGRTNAAGPRLAIGEVSALANGDNKTTRASAGGSLAIGVAIETGLNSYQNTQAYNKNDIAIGAGAHIDRSGYANAEGSNIVIGTLANSSSSADSIAIGREANGNGQRAISIGYKANKHAGSDPPKYQDCVAIGAEVEAHDGSVAIGGKRVVNNTPDGNNATKATGDHSVAIGAGTSAEGDNTVAIGSRLVLNTPQIDRATNATGEYSVAIGAGAIATEYNTVAIGAGASATEANTIVLGKASDTVVIPGNLRVDRSTVLGWNESNNDGVWAIARDDSNGDSSTLYRLFHTDGWGPNKTEIIRGKVNDDFPDGFPTGVSDRRLKNVGKAFEGGLADIKKLEVFNFTFKKDTENTPRVGVMAQDLQKIFPNAVTKGKDGFLRIRFEDMFFAMVNAIQELSAKIDNIIDKEIASIKTRLTDIEEQNRQLIEQFTAFDAKIKTVVDKNAEIDAKIQKVADKNTELENQLKEQNAQLEKQNKALTEKNAELEKVAKECAEHRAEIEKRLEALEKKLAE